MNVDYNRYFYCTTCGNKYLKEKCSKKGKITVCPEGHKVRTQRRRILTDFIEKRNKKDMIELARTYLPINERGKLLLSDLQDFADEFLFG